MKRRSLLLGALALGLTAAFPVAAMADLLADIKARGTLRAAIDLGSPPYGLRDANMQPIGSEVESAKLLAESLGVKLEIVEVTSTNRIPYLLTNMTDVVVASFSINEERKKVIDFADPHGVIQIIAAAPKSVDIKTVGDLIGRDVATTRGTTNDQEVSKQASAANIMRYDDDATLVTALVSDQNNIMVSSPSIMNAVNERRTNDPLKPKFVLKVNPYAVGLPKGEDALRAAINEWVKTDLANGKLRAVYKKYHNVDLPAEMPK